MLQSRQKYVLTNKFYDNFQVIEWIKQAEIQKVKLPPFKEKRPHFIG
jgi:hypothetical protein